MTLKPKFSWRQTSAKLILIINLHRCSSREVNVISEQSYLKVNFPRYCLELFLLHSVEDDSTVLRFNKKELEVILTKLTSEEWSSLEREINKHDAAKERKIALDQHHLKIQQNYRKLEERTVSQDKEGISKQIEVEERQQHLIEEKRNLVLKEYLEENKMKADLSSETSNKSLVTILSTRGSRRVSEDREYDGDGEDHYSSSEHLCNMLTISESSNSSVSRKPRRSTSKRTDASSANSDEDITSKTASSQSHRHCAKKGTAKKSSSTPKPEIRPPKSVEVTYTSRPDNLPARVSRDGHIFETEQGKQLNTGQVDVQQLLDQAKSQFDDGLYGECISTYTKVLSIVPDSVKALSNRAAAYIANSSHSLALSDTNQALSIIGSQSQSESTSQSKLLCLIRRGAAHSALGKLNEALNDYEEALSLQPQSTSLQRDCCNIRRALETSEGSSWVETEEESTF